MIETIMMIIVMLNSAVLPSSLDEYDATMTAKGNYTYSLDHVIEKNQTMTEGCDQATGAGTNSTIIVDMAHNEMARFCYD